MKSKPSSRKRKEGAAPAAKPVPSRDFLVVAIGASAGGLEAFSDLMRHLPPDTGMAFVLVQHLDPTHQSLLSELVARQTPMPVRQVENGMPIEPNRVYVTPPNVSMSLSGGVFQLTRREGGHSPHMTVDHFMRSLAEEYGNKAIGVILSGTGSDGTLGAMEIQAQGGVTFAQDETTAKYDGMPRSAIAAGGVDFVLSPEGIARELCRIGRHPYVGPEREVEELEPVPAEARGINAIFQLLRKNTGVDFTYYRHTTIRRRIQRRMVVHKFDKLDGYVRFLQQNPAEVRALYQDMLINVTSFFRNPRVFDALKKLVFPFIIKNHPPGTALRIWAPGCASGEETYSLAITLLEVLGDKATQASIQVFGTDVSESSINKARAGYYPENIQGDVSPERLRRFFAKVEGGYRIAKSIRDMCIFAEHNLISDPPFSHMDLICCRNLLIYLEPVLQKRIISLFHYALRNTGFLLLGSSEGIGTSSNMFSLEDRGAKIYSKKSWPSRTPVTFSLGSTFERPDSALGGRLSSKPADTSTHFLEAQKEFDRRILTQYAPASVFVNSDMEVLHSRGNIDRYLKLAPGRASLSILKMVREGLLHELRNAVSQALKTRQTVHKRDIRLKDNSESQDVSLEVVPVTVPNLKESFLMITFHEAAPAPLKRSRRAKETDKASAQAVRARLAKLEQELAANKEYLHAVIENQEVTNEELQSANEEILSSNEELQSTNEELETAKEELQSANEELTTVNEELRNRNLEISQVNHDLTNLLASINVPLVMVGNDLTIRRITPQAQAVLGIIPTDIGRPISNINPHIDEPDLQKLVQRVVEELKTVEKEVSDRNGRKFLLRIHPYRAENRIDGVVITLLDIGAVGMPAAQCD